VAGVSLSMALAFGGLWFVRRRSGDTAELRGSRALGLVIGVGLLGGLIASAVHADIAAPPGDVPPPPPPRPAWTSQIKIIPQGREIRIHLTQAHVNAIHGEWIKTAKRTKRR
ncbi:MAG: hypothetical protein OER86_08050, partial [Phycisphaerae bacterium]|nr:hypothetical protein [Phycisphaerae bacterium]